MLLFVYSIVILHYLIINRIYFLIILLLFLCLSFFLRLRVSWQICYAKYVGIFTLVNFEHVKSDINFLHTRSCSIIAYFV